MRYVPLIGVALLLGVGVAWRSWLQRRRHGTWGLALFTSREPRQILRDVSLFVLAFLLVGQASEAAFWPDRIAERMLMRPRDLAGTVALFGGIALMVQAQLHLGASWRI